jgi:GNAT superfamily N-acetyltransferase
LTGGAASSIRCRPAEVRDVEAIATLHADSWRRNYRGAYLDSYLDGDVLTDRLLVWRERIRRPDARFRTIVAERDGGFAGFAHANLDDDPRWGALLDNLHVVHGLKGQGIGTQLMAAVARAVLNATPGAGLYLWVLDANVAAQGFTPPAAVWKRGARCAARSRAAGPRSAAGSCGPNPRRCWWTVGTTTLAS